jgi:cytochrome d ubiquinol oxidase subunit II
VTVTEAAAAPATLAFTLVGAAICLPAVLAYTIYVYRVFRGKIDISHGYH